jgi:transmembrane sensor
MDQPMTNEEFINLAIKCHDGSATPAEQAAFDLAYITLSGRHTEWDNALMGEEETVRSAIYLSLIEKQRELKKSRIVYRIYRYAAAASILAILSLGIHIYFRQPLTVQQTVQNKTNDLKPGENRATLTLANGQQIVLTKSLIGQLGQQGGMKIQMTAGGKVMYTRSKTNDSNKEQLYNTLTTKKGEQFPLVLADGTQVTLDAASSITYPVSFTGKDRKVSITGQAYFQVVHNAHQPFIVSVKGQNIVDIGTEFNINAYDDEGPITTTLVSGSVKVSKENESVLLKPGQQSWVPDNGNQITVIKNADIATAIAWKIGLFQFNKASIQAVMRQFARWYDVDIQYKGTLPQREFSGKMQRNLNASQVLDLLAFTKIHFIIEGKKIIVTP